MNLLLPLAEPRNPAVIEAIDQLATTGGLEERGAVFTKAGIVDAILDLCGYMPNNALEDRCLLEPSFGDGDFLLPAIRRLVESARRGGADSEDLAELLTDSIRAVELHRETFDATSALVLDELVRLGVDEASARHLVDCWLVNDDFLLTEFEEQFDFVVGNPPYVRQERVPTPLLQEYKWRYQTLYDRADLYVLFYERGLDLLRPNGHLGFICANRWVKNKYGGPLREKVAGRFHLKYFIDVERASAFNSEVIAYPAITILERAKPGRTLVAAGARGEEAGFGEVVKRLQSASEEQERAVDAKKGVVEVPAVAKGRDPWLLDTPQILSLIRELEATFPVLEASGAAVGIGVATGADRVFIGDYDELPVESSRKLRLARANDCANGAINWGGKGVVNPYLESGQLAPLDDFPQFAKYLEENAEALKRRHTARRQPDRWYKTIDRIYPELTAQPKLLIPDIKGEATVAYDEGLYYPHHNLYVVTSHVWDLRALKAILRSSVALMFVAAYCTRMSGGFLRFQAQYLRRICCPNWGELSDTARRALIEVSTEPDQGVIDSVVLPLYGLDGAHANTVREYAHSARVVRKVT